MRRIVPLISLVALAVAGCDWFKDTDKKAKLPGERISVLAHERTLNPDQGTQGVEIMLPAPSPNDSWPLAGGFANHAMHHIQVGDSLRQAWKSSVGTKANDEMRIVAPPIVAEGKVFALDSETRVTALDAKTGDRLWRVDLTPRSESDDHIGGGIGYEKGRIVATTGFADVVALDAKTGKEIWRRHLDGPMRAAPLVRGGRVFAVTVENKTYALAAANGRDLWTHTGIAETASLLGGASPAEDQGVIVVPYSSGELVAMRVETGQVLWSESLASVRRTDELSTLSHIRGRPVIDRGLVFAMSHGETMVAVDLRSGRRVWEKRVGGMESPWIAGEYLFVLTLDGEVVCMARKDGSIHWVASLPRYRDASDAQDKENPLLWAGPVLVSDRLIVVGSHGGALALSPYTGELLGRQPLPDETTVPPVVAEGTVYFQTDNADIVAYR
ncbi:MAG: PQQ-binding-like beta-propeller repeat protein [Magnetospirillum sp. WYHS-4]